MRLIWEINRPSYPTTPFHHSPYTSLLLPDPPPPPINHSMYMESSWKNGFSMPQLKKKIKTKTDKFIEKRMYPLLDSMSRIQGVSVLEIRVTNPKNGYTYIRYSSLSHRLYYKERNKNCATVCRYAETFSQTVDGMASINWIRVTDKKWVIRGYRFKNRCQIR